MISILAGRLAEISLSLERIYLLSTMGKTLKSLTLIIPHVHLGPEDVSYFPSLFIKKEVSNEESP